MEENITLKDGSRVIKIIETGTDTVTLMTISKDGIRSKTTMTKEDFENRKCIKQPS